MAGEIATAFVRIKPDSSTFKSDLNRSTNGVGANVGRSIGKAMAVGIGAGIAVAAVGMGAAVKLAVGFDRAMRNVNSIAQLSESNFKQLNSQVLDLARSTGVGPEQLAEGLYDVVSSGFKAADALKILRAGARAGKAGLTDTATATGAVTAVLNAYHLSAKDAASVSDTLFQTVDTGVISFEQLAQNIGDVLPFASSLGINIQNVGASLATMTKEGINGAEATTRIKAVMTQFLSPSKELAAAFKEQGYESGEAMIKALGFQGSLDALAKSTGGSKAEMAKLFPDVRALGGALALTGANSRTANDDLQALTHSSGATMRALKEQAKSISFEWATMVAKLKVAGIRIGARVFPVLEWGINEASKFVEHIDGLIQKISGPTLNGKPLTFRQQAEIVWEDVQPQLEKAASSLWEMVQSGIGAAWDAAVGGETLEMPALPAFTPDAGGQTVIPIQVQFTTTKEGSEGPLAAWWTENGAPLIADFQGHGKETGDGFLSGLGESIRTNMPNVLGSAITLGIEAPMQLLDGIMRGDFSRIWQGIGSLNAPQDAIAKWGMELGPPLQQLGKDINDKLVDGIHAAPGALQSAGKWVNDRLVDGIHAGGGVAASAGRWVGGQIADAVRDGLSPLGSVGSWVSAKLSAIKSAGGRAYSLAVAVGARIVAGVQTGLATLFSAVVSAMASVANAVTNAASSAYSAATSLGSQIVSGIVSGVAGAAGSLYSALGNLASGALNAAKAKLHINSPSLLFADEVGGPIVEGIVFGINKKKKAISVTLTGATRQAVDDAKANLLSLAGGLGDSIAAIIDAQTKKKLAPLQAKLAGLQEPRADPTGDLTKQRATLEASLNGGFEQGETVEAYLKRQEDIRAQIADLDEQLAAAKRELDRQALQDQIDAIQTESDARRDAIDQQIADVTAMFNAGLISGEQLTQKINAILKASGASVAEAGKLLGFAFASQFKQQIGDVTAQVIALAGLLKLNGGKAGGAGFGGSITKPLDEVKNQIKDVTKDLGKDKGQLKDALERESAAKKALHDATTEKQRDAATKKLRDAQEDIRRERREIEHDRALLAALKEIVKAAQGVTIGTIALGQASSDADLLAALSQLAGAAER